MSISSLLSSSFNQSQLSGVSTTYQKQIQQLSQDLTSGNLSAAQSDFATLRAAFSQSPTSIAATSSPFSSTAPIASPAAQAFKQLSSDLQFGDLSAAQADVSTIQQDLQGATGTQEARHSHHLHHLGGTSGGGDSSSQTSLLQSLNQDLNQVGQSLSSGNLSSAQQAYATLQQQLQPFALGGGAVATSAAVSFDA